MRPLEPRSDRLADDDEAGKPVTLTNQPGLNFQESVVWKRISPAAWMTNVPLPILRIPVQEQFRVDVRWILDDWEGSRRSTLRGFDNDTPPPVLVIDRPEIPDEVAGRPLKPQEIQFEFRLNGRLHIFRVDRVEGRMDLWRLQLPEEINRYDQRQNFRLLIRPGNIAGLDIGGLGDDAAPLDISEGGMALEVPAEPSQLPPSGETVVLRILLTGLRRPLKISAIIRHVRPLRPPKQGTFVGLQFENLSSADRVAIRKFIQRNRRDDTTDEAPRIAA